MSDEKTSPPKQTESEVTEAEKVTDPPSAKTERETGEKKEEAGENKEKEEGKKDEGKKEERERYPRRPAVMEEVAKQGSKREFVPAKQSPRQAGKQSRQRQPARSRSDGGGREGRDDEFADRLVSINRVAKVVKGGRRFGFSALVVVGDNQGQVGYGTGKAKEIAEAVRKATEKGKRKMVKVMLREGRTLHHDIVGRYGSGRVVMRAATGGTGIIAGGPIRAVFEVLGIKDVVAKSIGSSNPHNMVKAAFAGLQRVRSPRSIAAKRGLSPHHFFGHNVDKLRSNDKSKSASSQKTAKNQKGQRAEKAKEPKKGETTKK